LEEISGERRGESNLTPSPPSRRRLSPVASPPTSVLTAKFEDLVAVGLTRLISEEPNLELVAADVPTEHLERAIEQCRPSVVVLNFGSLSSPAQVFELHKAHPDTRIVVLANRPTAAECNQMISFGATACLAKEVEGRDVINAVHLASRGMHVLPRSAGEGGAAENLVVQGSDLLTPREADVLELLQEGATNAQIAHTLSIGVETVRTHARNIYRKLGISSRRELGRLTRQDSAVVRELQPR
jgi:DNA-binding NarL/FixJ family response regulator